MRFLACAAFAAVCCFAWPAAASIDTTPERAHQRDVIDPVKVAAMPVVKLPRHRGHTRRVNIEATINGRKFHGTGTMRLERRNLEDVRPRKHSDPKPSKPAGPDGNLVQKARKYLGQTARQIGVRSTLWCSAFLRKITGREGVDDTARSWLGRPHIAAKIGAIVVLARKGGGHVGILLGFKSGNPVIISGNHGHRVAVATYPRSRVLAYVKA